MLRRTSTLRCLYFSTPRTHIIIGRVPLSLSLFQEKKQELLSPSVHHFCTSSKQLAFPDINSSSNELKQELSLQSMPFYKSFVQKKLFQAQQECILEVALDPSALLVHTYLNLIQDIATLPPAIVKEQQTVPPILDMDHFNRKCTNEAQKETLKELLKTEQKPEGAAGVELVSALLHPLFLILEQNMYFKLRKNETLELKSLAIQVQSEAKRIFYFSLSKDHKLQTSLITSLMNDFDELIKIDNEMGIKDNLDPLLNSAFLLIEHITRISDANEKEKAIAQAETRFKHVLEVKSEEVEAHYGLGKVHQARREFHDAAVCFSACISLSKEYAPAYLSRAECFFEMKNYGPAGVDAEDFLKSHQTYYDITGVTRAEPISHESVVSSATLLQGICNYKMQEPEIATQDFDLVIKLGQKETGLAYHYRAKCKLEKRKWHESIEDNTKAIEHNSELAGAFKDRADAQEIVGNMEQAKEDKRIFAMLMGKKEAEGVLPKET